MSNHYKMRIQELEASRLKLIQDAREAREECEKLKAQLKRTRTQANELRKDLKAKCAEYNRLSYSVGVDPTAGAIQDLLL